MARQEGGIFVLRLEDIDPVRCKAEFVESIFEDLRWLGLAWEEPVRFQSRHLNEYAPALSSLRDMGLLYPCFCSRREILEEVASAAHAPQVGDNKNGRKPDGPVYPGTCRKLSKTERDERLAKEGSANWRLDMTGALKRTGALQWHDRARGPVIASPEDFGDIILARKDVPTSYHLSVTVDDHLQGITLVTRGEDLLRSTDIHRLLQALLGFKTPEYHHHRLILDANGRRLAKRDQATSLRALREAGLMPESIRKTFIDMDRITT
jgi:glutamyl-Q tRNA(Asp) synthetase